MVRKDDWKLVYDSTGRGELYDLSEDPFELEDRFDAPEQEETRRALLEELVQWQMRIRDPLPFPGQHEPKTHAHNYWT